MPNQTYKVAFSPTGASRVNADAKKLEKTMSDVGKSMMLMRTRIEQILGLEIISKITGMFGAISAGAGKAKSGLSMAFLPVQNSVGAFKNMRRTGQGVFKSLGMGAKSFGMTSKAVFAMGTKAMLGFAASATTIFAPLIAGIALIYVFKKIWQANIGGIATRFYKVLGRMKSWWGRFNAEFIKILRKWTPVFNVIFDALESFFKSVFMPMIDIGKDLGKMFKSLFGDSEGSMKAMMVYFKIWGFYLKVIGKIIGVIVKVSFMPLKFLIWTIVTYIKVWKKSFEWFRGTRVFGGLMVTLKAIGRFFISIKDSIMGIVDAIMNAINVLLSKIPEPLKKLIGLGGLSMDLSESPNNMANQVSNRYDRTTNNNQQITFNTGRATTPDQSEQFAEMFKRQLVGDM